jgi:SAM-dependent methyltransferase
MSDEGYYTHARPEVARLVPRTARNVIDVGCATGALGRGLKRERPDLAVRGIEPFADAAAAARLVLDDAHQGRAEDPPPPAWPAADCVIMADVLEHLVDPWSTLRAWRERAPGATFVISLPNVTHWSVRRDLLLGRFRYQDEGILDRTHLRFFDAPSAVALVDGSGLRLERFERVILGDRPRTVPAKIPRGRGGPLRAVLDVVTFQFLMVAR